MNDKTNFIQDVRRHAYDPQSDFFKSQSDWDLMNSQSDKVEFLFDLAEDPKCPHADVFYSCLSYFFDLQVLNKKEFVTLNEYLFFVLRPDVKWENMLSPPESVDLPLAKTLEAQRALDDHYRNNHEERVQRWKDKEKELILDHQHDLEVAHRLMVKMSKSGHPNIKWLFDRIIEEFK